MLYVSMINLSSYSINTNIMLIYTKYKLELIRIIINRTHSILYTISINANIQILTN